MEYKPTKQKLKPRYFCFLNFDLDPVTLVLTLDPDIEGCICKYRMNFPFQLVQNLIHTHTHTHTHKHTHTQTSRHTEENYYLYRFFGLYYYKSIQCIHSVFCKDFASSTQARDPRWILNSLQMSLKVQNRAISGPTKVPILPEKAFI